MIRFTNSDWYVIQHENVNHDPFVYITTSNGIGSVLYIDIMYARKDKYSNKKPYQYTLQLIENSLATDDFGDIVIDWDGHFYVKDEGKFAGQEVYWEINTYAHKRTWLHNLKLKISKMNFKLSLEQR